MLVIPSLHLPDRATRGASSRIATAAMIDCSVTPAVTRLRASSFGFVSPCLNPLLSVPSRDLLNRPHCSITALCGMFAHHIHWFQNPHRGRHAGRSTYVREDPRRRHTGAGHPRRRRNRRPGCGAETGRAGPLRRRHVQPAARRTGPRSSRWTSPRSGTSRSCTSAKSGSSVPLEPDNLRKVRARADELGLDLEIGMRSICPTSAMFDKARAPPRNNSEEWSTPRRSSAPPSSAPCSAAVRIGGRDREAHRLDGRRAEERALQDHGCRRQGGDREPRRRHAGTRAEDARRGGRSRSSSASASTRATRCGRSKIRTSRSKRSRPMC